MQPRNTFRILRHINRCLGASATVASIPEGTTSFPTPISSFISQPSTSIPDVVVSYQLCVRRRVALQSSVVFDQTSPFDPWLHHRRTTVCSRPT
ncbi:hypothetical protein Hypma_000612 [Hypsizygus marmoreus]|uniref:Uncharacterized protein n=1 Tax=Hypsizygus marmoreus TaxID=39966 RepID=A0A369JH35_HYPMA|nr:hypothetical protein Hypma_000612 [Hypsizygus marmoreus]